MEWKIVIEDQDDKRVHFKVFQYGNLCFEDPNFDKNGLIELITEGNHDI